MLQVQLILARSVMNSEQPEVVFLVSVLRYNY